MDVIYFVDIIKELLEAGASKTEVMAELRMKKQNMREILGNVPGKQRQNLKDEQLPGLLRLCRKYKRGPQTERELLRMISGELEEAS